MGLRFIVYRVLLQKHLIYPSDIMNNVTPTKGLIFKDIYNPNTNEYISGPHTRSSAGSLAHIVLDELYHSSSSYGEYVERVRDWADLHVEGGADSLPGYFKRGEPLPDHLIGEEEIKTDPC